MARASDHLLLWTNSSSQSHLLVQAKGEEFKPSYYRLESEGTKACLATDFTLNNATNGTIGFENTSEASRAPDEAFYSQVAVHDGTGTCKQGKNASCTADFEPDEKVNSLSLIMLFLRILFLKAVTFNVLMTLRLWIH